MSIKITDRKRYICVFGIFTIIFCLIMSLLIFLGIYSNRRYAAPTVTDSESPITVVIDAGHGGEDGGAVGVNGVYEKDVNLAIALMLNDILRINGIETVMTRSEDILLYDKNSDYHGQKKVQDLMSRRRIAEGYDKAVFVSIHMNAFPEEKYSGLQVYYSQNNEGSEKLAEDIQTAAKETIMPTNTRRCKAADNSIYLLDRLNCPAVMIECGFLSNPEECERLSDRSYQRKLAMCIAASIINYVSSEENPY